MPRRFLGALIALGLVLSPFAASAADVEEEAAAAYDRGASAYDRGDFTTAATELARADELAPNDVTLELALNAASRTTDAVSAMKLVERAEKRAHASKRLVTVTDNVRKKFGGSVGRINIACSGEPACEAAFDDRPIDVNRPTLVAAGKHRVTITRADSRETHDVVIDGGKTVELLATVSSAPSSPRPAIAPTASAEPQRGFSPVWFWVGAGVTVAVGGATVFSALDTASTHDEFAADRSNVDLANEGQSAERRTIILGAVTGVLAVTTAVVGLALVDWNKGKVAIGPGAMRVRF
jgi:hypothetical protein